MPNRFSTAIEHRRRIRRSVTYLEARLRDSPCAWPTLQELAEVACLSEYHFIRVYRHATGETPQATVRRLKLDAARLALASAADRRSVLGVALAHGYDSPQAFARAFRQQFGAAPSVVAAVTSAAQAWVTRLPALAFQALALAPDGRAVGEAFDEMMAVLDVAGVPRFGQDMFGVLTPDLRFSHACALQNRWVDGSLRLSPRHGGDAWHLCISGAPAAVWRHWREPLIRQARRDDAPVLLRYLNDPAYRAAPDQRIELYVPLRCSAGELAMR